MRKSILVLALILALPILAQEGPFVVRPDVGNLYAYASNGRLVGTFTPVPAGFTGNDIGGIIRMDVVGEGIVFLPVTRAGGGLVWNTPSVHFTGANCTGDAFLVFAKSVTGVVAGVGIDSTLYIGPSSSEADEGPRLVSQVRVEDDGSRRCVPTSVFGRASRLKPTARLDDHFPAPFDLEPGARSQAIRH